MLSPRATVDFDAAEAECRALRQSARQKRAQRAALRAQLVIDVQRGEPDAQSRARSRCRRSSSTTESTPPLKAATRRSPGCTGPASCAATPRHEIAPRDGAYCCSASLNLP